MLQTHLKDLKQLTENEVWMLARMRQLDNKILPVGESSYRARRGRVKRVLESLENTLLTRIELMESYAKFCSMIEIEVVMNSNVIAAEAASSAERISEQIQQLMKIDSLEDIGVYKLRLMMKQKGFLVQIHQKQCLLCFQERISEQAHHTSHTQTGQLPLH